MRRTLAALALVVFAVAANAAAAPTQKLEPAKTAPAPARPSGLSSDMAIGAKTATVEVVEYASLACPHCREFHKTVLKAIRTKYVDAGKVRWVFREYPTEPVVMAVAGFQLARCKNADAKTYFNRLDAIFEAQPDIFTAMQVGQGRVKFEELASKMGVSVPEFQACLMDESANARITEVVQRAESDGLTSTPTLVIAGELIPYQDNTIEGVSRHIDDALAAAARARQRK